MSWLNKQRYNVVDYFRKTAVSGLLQELDSSQWLSKEQLDEIQFKALKKLLVHCEKNVPFYQVLFKKHNFSIENFEKVSDLEKLPLLTKNVIRENTDKLKANNIETFLPRPKTTGGSTGQPITVFEDKVSQSYRHACNMRGWQAATDYELGDKFVTIAHGSLLPKNNTLKNKIYFFFQNSDLITSYHLNDERIKEAIATIENSKGKLMYGYSSSIFMLAKFAHGHNIKINSKLQAIVSTSDMLYDNQRRLIEDVFGVKVFDSYGCPESGLISFECEHHSGYHLNHEAAYVEIVNTDEKGLGKIVSTPLYNYAYPLLRYDTGDVGKISHEKCSCGRWLPRISELGGRIRDFIILKDGRYIHGAFFNHFKPFYENSWIDEYQIVQDVPEKITIRVNTRRVPTDEEKKLIVEELRKGLLQDLEIDFDLGGVEYTKGGKFRLIISNVRTKWEN